IFAELGSQQSVCDGRRRVSAESRIQSNRDDSGTGLLVGQRNHHAISEKSWPAGSRVGHTRSFRNKGLRGFAEHGNRPKLSVQNFARIERILVRLDSAKNPEEMNMPGL